MYRFEKENELLFVALASILNTKGADVEMKSDFEHFKEHQEIKTRVNHNSPNCHSYQKIKIYHTILGSFLDRRRAENLKMSLLKLNLGEVQILEKTALGFHRVSIKRDRSYRTALKELPDYVEQGYLDAWIVPYVVEK